MFTPTDRGIVRAILQTQIVILRHMGKQEQELMALQAILNQDEQMLEDVLTAISTDLDEIKAELAANVGEPLTQDTVDKFTALAENFQKVKEAADALVVPATQPTAPAEGGGTEG